MTTSAAVAPAAMRGHGDGSERRGGGTGLGMDLRFTRTGVGHVSVESAKRL